MYLCTFLYFCNLFGNGCGRSRSTCMQNFGLLVQKLSELCSILFYAPCRPVPPVTNLPVELCASRQLIMQIRAILLKRSLGIILPSLLPHTPDEIKMTNTLLKKLFLCPQIQEQKKDSKYGDDTIRTLVHYNRKYNK